MSETDLFEQMAVRLAERIEAHVEASVEKLVSNAFKSHIALVFDEEEAAAFLKVSTDTLASWRKRSLVEYARYPVSRIRKEGDEAKLSDLITYDLAGLLSFRAKYIIKAVGKNRFELEPRLTLVGAAVKDAA